jgi:hypothetical protein
MLGIEVLRHGFLGQYPSLKHNGNTLPLDEPAQNTRTYTFFFSLLPEKTDLWNAAKTFKGIKDFPYVN